MKKILTNILATFLLITALPSVSAEVSKEILAEVIHTAEDSAHPETLKGEFDYGKNHSETDMLCSEIDFSKMYRRYIVVRPLDEYIDFYLKSENKGLLKYERDDNMDKEIYVGNGNGDDKIYYLSIKDPWYGLTQEELENNPHLYVGAFEYGEEPYSSCYEITSINHNFDLEDYAKALANLGVSEVYDAYLSVYHIGSQGSNKCHIAYFDTDIGEYVMNIDKEQTKITHKSDEELEYMKLYTIEELDSIASNILKDIHEYDMPGAQINEDGDDVEVEKPAVNNKSDNSEEDDEKMPKEEIEEPKSEEVPNDIEEEQPKEEEPEEPEENPEVPVVPSDEIRVDLRGEFLSFPDQKPIIENDRVLVPFRVIFEALEADVLWDGDTRTVTATKGDITISLTIGENKIVKNGEIIEIDVPAQIQNSRTLVPIRVVSESLENVVSWDGANRIVEIK